MTCPAVSCMKGVELGLPVCAEAQGQNRLSFLLPLACCGSWVYRREQRTSAASTNNTATLPCPAAHQSPGTPCTQCTRGRDGRRTGDLWAQHEERKDSLRPEKATSRGLESFATGSGHLQRAPEHL